jgi:hypothetical protein
MNVAALAIQTEAWLQEELGAQRALLEALARTEQAARGSDGAELERRTLAVQALLGETAPRDARRRALLGRLTATLSLAPGEVALSRLVPRLAAAGVDVQRLEAARVELRGVVARVVKTGRRLAALARYHRGLLEELCQLLIADAPPGAGGHLVDARA